LKTVALDALSPEPERAAEETAGPQPAGGAGQAVGAILQSIASLSSEPAVVEDLPAIELGGAKPRLRPTLFLGVGGLAARVERRLRRRLYERFGDLAAVPAIQMLLVDTDPKTAVQATQGDHASCLEARETVTLPLRRPQDYREEAEKHLEWLSRRWLYNVPRSLQTEGLRPLGRLALMDHAGEVFQSLRRAIGAMTSPDALAESSKQAGLEAGDDAPQVFVISSICGGTGSGMVIDLAYAVRMVLAEFHCANQRVYGVLTHSTGRNPSAADVAVANTCACLTELEHYHRAGGYAGDPEWRLPPSVAGSPVFDETYLVDVGNCRDDADFERATAALADYLYLDSVTAGGDFFRQCRDLARAASPPRRQDLTLRTFGLFRIGASDGPIATAAESYLHKAVLDHWRSTDGPRDATTSHLDLELLVSQLRESIRRRLGGDAKACFQEVLSRCAAHGARGSAAPRDVPGSQLMEATDAFLGLPPPDGNPRKSRTDCLPEWLAAELKGRSAEQGAALSSGILEAANIPQSRIGGAQRLARSIADRLRSLEGTVRNDLQAASASLESLQCDLLSAGDQDPEIAERRQRAAPAHRAVPGTDPRWLRYFELRIDETVLRGTLFWLRSVRCQVDAAADQLNAVIAELNILAEASDTPEPGKRLDLGSEVALAPPYDLRASVARTLSARLGELTAQVDRQCWGALLGRQGGLEGLLRDKSGLRTALREEIHRAARSALHEAFKRIDVAAMLLQADGDAGQPPRALRDLVETAAPRWLSAGGSRRFALIGPQSPAIPLLKAAFREGLGLSLSIVCDDRDGWAICCEAEGLSLARVAASLLAQRPQCADIASRLHTRRDVTWLPIASMCQVAADDLLADSQLLGNLRDGRTGVPAGEGAEQDPKPFDEGIRPAQGVSR
jgi:hypothetical protein